MSQSQSESNGPRSALPDTQGFLESCRDACFATESEALRKAISISTDIANAMLKSVGVEPEQQFFLKLAAMRVEWDLLSFCHHQFGILDKDPAFYRIDECGDEKFIESEKKRLSVRVKLLLSEFNLISLGWSEIKNYAQESEYDFSHETPIEYYFATLKEIYIGQVQELLSINDLSSSPFCRETVSGQNYLNKTPSKASRNWRIDQRKFFNDKFQQEAQAAKQEAQRLAKAAEKAQSLIKAERLENHAKSFYLKAMQLQLQDLEWVELHKQQGQRGLYILALQPLRHHPKFAPAWERLLAAHKATDDLKFRNESITWNKEGLSIPNGRRSRRTIRANLNNFS